MVVGYVDADTNLVVNMNQIYFVKKEERLVAEREELAARIDALEKAGIDASGEKAELAVMAVTNKPAAKATVATVASGNEDFVPLNTDGYETGGGGWVAPATVGVKDAVCEGYMVPEFVDDQLWFIFRNTEYPGGSEPFRGASICGAISKPPGQGGAWKVKDVAIALGIEGSVKIVEGKGITGLKACEGKPCKVLWDDIVLKGKTERRIQDVMSASAEPVM